jgi:hypothetical protein
MKKHRYIKIRRETTISNCAATAWGMVDVAGSETVNGIKYTAIQGPHPAEVAVYWLDYADYLVCLAQQGMGLGGGNCTAPTYPSDAVYWDSQPGAELVDYTRDYDQSAYDNLPSAPSCESNSEKTIYSDSRLSDCPSGEDCTLPEPNYSGQENLILSQTSSGSNYEWQGIPGTKTYSTNPPTQPYSPGDEYFIPGAPIPLNLNVNVFRDNTWDVLEESFSIVDEVSCECYAV